MSDHEANRLLGEAVEEIYFLRALLADEAEIIEAHMDYRTFPKTRRVIGEEQVERMRVAARGGMYAATRERFNAKRALRSAGASDLLTNHQWLTQRGLINEDGDLR